VKLIQPKTCGWWKVVKKGWFRTPDMEFCDKQPVVLVEFTRSGLMPLCEEHFKQANPRLTVIEL